MTNPLTVVPRCKAEWALAELGELLDYPARRVVRLILQGAPRGHRPGRSLQSAGQSLDGARQMLRRRRLPAPSAWYSLGRAMLIAEMLQTREVEAVARELWYADRSGPIAVLRYVGVRVSEAREHGPRQRSSTRRERFPVRRFVWTRRSVQPRNTDRDQRIRELVRGGAQSAEVASIYDITPQRVGQIVRAS
jgi:hypothetical protein